MLRHKFNYQENRLGLALCLGVLFLMMLAVVNSSAQSTDIDNPTPFVTTEVSGFGPGKKTEYFYSFIAVPGNLQVKIEAKAAKYPDETGLIFELFDNRSSQIAYAIVDPLYGATKREIKTTEISRRQRLIVKLTVTKSIESFRITLDGRAVPVRRDNTLINLEKESSENDLPAGENLIFRGGQTTVFKTGTTDQTRYYFVKVRAGKAIAVSLTSKDGIARFDVIALPGSGTPFVREKDEWVTRRSGEYVIQVYGLYGRKTIYSLDVTVR